MSIKYNLNLANIVKESFRFVKTEVLNSKMNFALLERMKKL